MEQQKKDSLSTRVQMLREASRTERCHTMPHHGTYTVGQHSFDMVTMLLALYPTCSKELMVACIAHDLPERWVGDVPAPTKWTIGGDVAKHLNLMEERINQRLEMDTDLSSMEREWLRGLDRAELLLWAKEQIAMGNQNVSEMVCALAAWFETNRHQLPKELLNFIADHKWTRTTDFIFTRQ